ncbi:MAG: hypothetical protein J0J10_23315 [Bosea sp.]|uniref:hypothetical protein n=1 Tax=Bosea sp. (in: a-proteobacteria) TaxID=1871050 RepID=UPI001AC27433|nr:hypothetical protein [Bosea sp. (in: a-proteobacteria)]MBN9471703.1 hypothetical protein [Bosea sp. (in: a-proteobacteria)]
MKQGGDIEIFTALCLLSDAVQEMLDARTGTRRHDRAMARLRRVSATVGMVMFDAPMRLEALDDAEWKRRIKLLNAHALEVQRWCREKQAAEACR